LAGAEHDLDEAISRGPALTDAYVNRALVRNQKALKQKGPADRKKLQGQAVEDLSRALELKTAHTRVYFMRARIRDQLGDGAGARADRKQGLALVPSDEADILARGMARLETGDVNGSLVDFEAVLKRNPWSYPALSNRAYILAEKQGKLPEAVGILNRAVEHYPDNVRLRGGRAVYLARLGRRREALADVRECLQRDTSATLLYQMAGVCSLLSRGTDDNHREALKLFASALRKGFDQLPLAQSDPDLAALRRDPEFWRLLRAARLLTR
jgi:tetratricopeptide (TPR) repeat protein